MSPATSPRSAADALGWSVATVYNRLRDGQLKGTRGPQPHRPRWTVDVDDEGWLLDGVGSRLANVGPNPAVREPSAEVLERLRRIEELVGRRLSPAEPGDIELLRDVALQLRATIERQLAASALRNQAEQLQIQAIELLETALAEQAEVIAGLILPSSPADVLRGHA